MIQCTFNNRVQLICPWNILVSTLNWNICCGQSLWAAHNSRLFIIINYINLILSLMSKYYFSHFLFLWLFKIWRLTLSFEWLRIDKFYMSWWSSRIHRIIEVFKYFRAKLMIFYFAISSFYLFYHFVKCCCDCDILFFEIISKLLCCNITFFKG